MNPIINKTNHSNIQYENLSEKSDFMYIEYRDKTLFYSKIKSTKDKSLILSDGSKQANEK